MPPERSTTGFTSLVGLLRVMIKATTEMYVQLHVQLGHSHTWHAMLCCDFCVCTAKAYVRLC